jgi:hypothetical protein
MIWKLFIDDVRELSDVFKEGEYDAAEWQIHRTVDEARLAINRQGMPIHIAFDHDLGPGEDSGLSFAKWVVWADENAPGTHSFPEGFTYSSHSANTDGRKNILSYLESYFKVRGHDDIRL